MSHAKLSPRRRRVRVTLAVLGGGVVLLAAGIAAWQLASRPDEYRPGEASADVTSELTRNLPPDAPKPRLTDVTEPAGLARFRTFAGVRSSQLPEDNGPGLAWGDFDNDGDDDLFLVSAGGPLTMGNKELARCELHENLGNGRFQVVQNFPEIRIRGMAAAWGDSNEDGYLDLVISGYNALLLLRNEQGTGRFTRDERFPDLKGYWAGVAWGDFDRDRHLDLYVCGYVQYMENLSDRERVSLQIGTAVPFTLNPASYTPGTNLLFQSRGDGSFVECAGAFGVQNPEGRSLAALWHDFDDDGWQDLYVANDISDNVLYYNTSGRFQDISHAAHVADYRSAMGLAAGDFDRDGDDDLFIGHWVAQENGLYQNLLIERKGTTVQNGSNQPPLRFLDVADMKGVGQIALPYVSWGAEFVDLDADGWLDLLVANGNTIEEDGPTPKKLKAQDSFLFWNRRGEYFHNLAPLAPALGKPRISRGLAVSDYDQDGDMDIALTHLGEGVQLLRNDMQTGNWAKIRLRSLLRDGTPRGFADGARVTAWAGGIAFRRSVTGVSYLSQSSRTLHFGLGSASRLDRVEVRWLGGGTNTFEALDANRTWEITEGEGHPKAVPASTAVTQHERSAPSTGLSERERLVQFWKLQRSAMDALKVENNPGKATGLFEQALALDPRHEDSLYYLAHCFTVQGRVPEALALLERLTTVNPRSHRGFQQWGRLRALTARSPEELQAAEKALEQAHAVNPEETGALRVLGEVSLLQGNRVSARERLEAVCRTNPRAAAALFMRGYVAWTYGQEEEARHLLVEARNALGPEWKPQGSTSEGDVRRLQHSEATPLSKHFDAWNGKPDPARAFAGLHQQLTAVPQKAAIPNPKS